MLIAAEILERYDANIRNIVGVEHQRTLQAHTMIIHHLLRAQGVDPPDSMADLEGYTKMHVQHLPTQNLIYESWHKMQDATAWWERVEAYFDDDDPYEETQ